MIPIVVSNAIVIPVGSWSDPKEYPGLAHYVEHYVSKVSHKRLNDVSLSFYLSQIGCDLHFFTTYDRTVFQVTCLREQQNDALNVLKQCLFNPVFEEDELSEDWFVERRLLEQELFMDDGEFQPHKIMLSSVFGERSLYSRPSIGNFESLFKVSTQNLFQFWSENYAPENTAIITHDGNQKVVMRSGLKFKRPHIVLNSSRLFLMNKTDWDTFSLTVYVFPQYRYGKSKDAILLYKLTTYVWDACFHRMKLAEGTLNDCHVSYHVTPWRISLWLNGSQNRLDELLGRFYEYMVDFTEFLSLELIVESLLSMQLHYAMTLQSPDSFVYSVAKGYHDNPLEELSIIQKWLINPDETLERVSEFFKSWQDIPKIAILAGNISEVAQPRFLNLQLGSLQYLENED